MYYCIEILTISESSAWKDRPLLILSPHQQAYKAGLAVSKLTGLKSFNDLCGIALLYLVLNAVATETHVSIIVSE